MVAGGCKLVRHAYGQIAVVLVAACLLLSPGGDNDTSHRGLLLVRSQTSYEVIGGQRYVLGLSWRQLRSGQGKKKTDDTAERCA